METDWLRDRVMCYRAWSPPNASYVQKRYENRPMKIEDYEPGMSSLASRETYLVLSRCLLLNSLKNLFWLQVLVPDFGAIEILLLVLVFSLISTLV